MKKIKLYGLALAMATILTSHVQAAGLSEGERAAHVEGLLDELTKQKEEAYAQEQARKAREIAAKRAEERKASGPAEKPKAPSKKEQTQRDLYEAHMRGQ